MWVKTIGMALLLLGVGCNRSGHQDSEQTEQEDNISLDSASKSKKSFQYVPKDAFWEYQFDTISNDFKLVKLREVKPDSLTVEGVTSIVNTTWPDVQVQYRMTSGDTVYLEVPESTILSQQMGSAGAQQFLSSTTYSFTELAGINYVFFDFDEGDHAVPGVYHRNSWKR